MAGFGIAKTGCRVQTFESLDETASLSRSSSNYDGVGNVRHSWSRVKVRDCRWDWNRWASGNGTLNLHPKRVLHRGR